MSEPIVSDLPSVDGYAHQPVVSCAVQGGKPEIREKLISRSPDWMAHLILWECTAGSFEWHYERDEFITVISGEAFLLDERGMERRIGPGDVVFFPAGCSRKWRVPGLFRKIAVIRETVWSPLGYCIKAINKVLRVVGIKGRGTADPCWHLDGRVGQMEAITPTKDGTNPSPQML